jgi:hypothetical protein
MKYVMTACIPMFVRNFMDILLLPEKKKIKIRSDGNYQELCQELAACWDLDASTIQLLRCTAAKDGRQLVPLPEEGLSELRRRVRRSRLYVCGVSESIKITYPSLFALLSFSSQYRPALILNRLHHCPQRNRYVFLFT